MLRRVTRAAVNLDDLETTEQCELLGGLLGQFAGRGQHDHARQAAALAARLHAGDDRQRERQRLARTRAGAAQDVAAL